jgi:hypothetical protein
MVLGTSPGCLNFIRKTLQDKTYSPEDITVFSYHDLLTHLTPTPSTYLLHASGLSHTPHFDIGLELPHPLISLRAHSHTVTNLDPELKRIFIYEHTTDDE